MGDRINYNGELRSGADPIIISSNRAVRFGDALFETMRVYKGKILFGGLHEARLFRSLLLLQFNNPDWLNWSFLSNEILRTITNEQDHHRVRLTIMRGNGDLNEVQNQDPLFLIEYWPIEKYTLLEDGITLDLYEGARKDRDQFSNLKSANFLPYVMASIFAKRQEVDDCILLNSMNRICDSTISNVFWIMSGKIYTPPLSEGPIAGTLREYLIRELKSQGYGVAEIPAELGELLEVDEIFLTNVIRGIRWVRSFRGKKFKGDQSKELFKKIIQPLTEY